MLVTAVHELFLCSFVPRARVATNSPRRSTLMQGWQDAEDPRPALASVAGAGARNGPPGAAAGRARPTRVSGCAGQRRFCRRFAPAKRDAPPDVTALRRARNRFSPPVPSVGPRLQIQRAHLAAG
jgi:hypothetical protein